MRQRPRSFSGRLKHRCPRYLCRGNACTDDCKLASCLGRGSVCTDLCTIMDGTGTIVASVRGTRGFRSVVGNKRSRVKRVCNRTMTVHTATCHRLYGGFKSIPCINICNIIPGNLISHSSVCSMYVRSLRGIRPLVCAVNSVPNVTTTGGGCFSGACIRTLVKEVYLSTTKCRAHHNSVGHIGKGKRDVAFRAGKGRGGKTACKHHSS